MEVCNIAGAEKFLTKNARFLNIWEQWKLFVGKLSGNFKAQCPRRLGVRTPEPHSGNSGSNPLGGALLFFSGAYSIRREFVSVIGFYSEGYLWKLKMQPA